MTSHAERSMLEGPAMMFISAAIFGWFGFGIGWSHTSGITGQVLPFVVLFDWTLKTLAVAFLLSALVTFGSRLAGNLLYSVVGLLGAAMFLAIAAMDFADSQHTVIHLFGLPGEAILLLFAAWTGYGSWTGLRAVMAVRGRDEGTKGRRDEGGDADRFR